MLRRRHDDTFEFRDIERVLYSIQPPALAPERKDALRLRIMASLGEQEEARRGLAALTIRERWIAVPAGAGLAAAILAGAYIMNPGQSAAPISGTVTYNGVAIERPQPGQLMVAVSNAQLRISSNILVSMDAGARFSYAESNGNVTLQPLSGRTMVTTTEPATVAGAGWSARMSPGSTAVFEFAAAALTIEVPGGVVVLSVTGQPDRSITDADGIVSIIPGTPADPGTGMGGPAGPVNPTGNGQAPPSGGNMPGHVEEEDDDGGPSGESTPAKPVPPGTGSQGDGGPANGEGSPATPGNGTNPGRGNGPAAPPTTPPKADKTPPATPAPQGTPGTPPEHADVDPPAQPPANPGGGAATPETPVGPPDNLPGGGETPTPDGDEDGGSTESGDGEQPGPGGGEPGGNGQGSNNGNGPGSNNGSEPGANSGNGPDANSGNGPDSNNGNGPGSNNGNGSGSNNGNGKQAESSTADAVDELPMEEPETEPAVAPSADAEAPADRGDRAPGGGHAFGRDGDKGGPPAQAGGNAGDGGSRGNSGRNSGNR